MFFDYDSLCNLVRGDYSLHDRIFRTPDKVGNLYREPECRGRRYDRGGRLLWDGEYHYSYDCEGNLVRKSRREHHSSDNPDERKLRTKPWVRKERTDGDIAGSSIPRKGGMDFVDWEPGDTCYEWQPNGMLAGVRTADGMTVTFGYDALGRRVSKTIGDTVRRFGWDGNVLLHEWEIPVDELPRLVVSEDGAEKYDRPEIYRGLVTWVYDGESFTPVAKVTEKDRYTIVHDYLGTPTQAYDSEGNLVWEMLLDVYGEVMESRGDRSLVPFRYQGQYEDMETGLYYNRFRYYSPEMGMYISSDPIGLAGNNPTLYGYVQDVNTWLDILGLIVLPDFTYNSDGTIHTATATITSSDLGTGTNTNASSRRYARSLGSPTDDAGHIIGKQLGGSGGKANVFPQNPNVNRGSFAQFEGRVASLVHESESVNITITFEYDSGTRPTSVRYEAVGNHGRKLTQTFKNTCN